MAVPSSIARLVSRFDVDRATLIAIGARGWQAIAGLGTLSFVITFLTADVQGYYQTFLSLVALQSFLELGILIAIVSVASHEWGRLTPAARTAGSGGAADHARLAATLRFVVIWFTLAAAAFALVGGLVGHAVLAQRAGAVDWRAAWIAVICLAAGNFWTQGPIALLEGCSQVSQVAVLRLSQGVAGIVALWIALALGGGLWAMAAQLATNLALSLVFLGIAYRRFLLDLWRNRAASDFRWRIDVWPMQWPLALQGLAAYFNFSLFAPVLFTYHGSIQAGQIGLSLQMIMALMSLATAFLSVKAPRLGALYAGGDRHRFEVAWRKAAIASLATMLTGATGLFGLVLLGSALGFNAMHRFADPVSFAMLLAWGLTLQSNQCLATYWRAQRREPLGFWGVLPGTVTGLAVWSLGRQYAAPGAAGGALAATLTTALPLCLYFFRDARARAAAQS